jgi:tetratricopeptide (TPR) repeat protein
MSNSFPKISPDGKWIVFVQCANGQLMRPDGLLYIVPSSGGEARRMRCNTPLMNSWHSFSPNGRWMVFSSKSRSPYTRMFLTHVDAEGNDSPAILIENATAANRAVNIPEFVNIAADGLLDIQAPAAEFYRHYYTAWQLTQEGKIREAMSEYVRALELDPGDIKARNNFAALLVRQGRLDEAVEHFEKVLEVNPEFVNVRSNLGLVLLQKGRVKDAIAQLLRCLEINPGSTEALVNLGNAFMVQGNFRDALGCWREALRLEPDRLPPLRNIAWMLGTCPDASIRDGRAAVEAAEQANRATGGKDPELLDVLAAAYAEAGRFSDAVTAAQQGLRLAANTDDPVLEAGLKSRLALYERNKPFHDTR